MNIHRTHHDQEEYDEDDDNINQTMNSHDDDFGETTTSVVDNIFDVVQTEAPVTNGNPSTIDPLTLNVYAFQENDFNEYSSNSNTCHDVDEEDGETEKMNEQY